MLEREIKLRFSSAAEARVALVAAGAEPLAPRRLQDDTLFDTPERALFGQASALRVRREGGRGVVTFKGPIRPGVMKVREEIESNVDDPDAMQRVIEALGFRPWFRYQKYREELAAPGVTAAIDETPAGVWVELEGDAPGITALAARLGRSESDYVTSSYRTLWTELHGDAAGDMIF